MNIKTATGNAFYQWLYGEYYIDLRAGLEHWQRDNEISFRLVAKRRK